MHIEVARARLFRGTHAREGTPREQSRGMCAGSSRARERENLLPRHRPASTSMPAVAFFLEVGVALFFREEEHLCAALDRFVVGDAPVPVAELARRRAA